MKLSAKLLISSSVLFGLVLLGWFQDKKEQKKQKSEDEAAALLNAKVSDVAKLVMKTSTQTLTFERRVKDAQGKYTDEFAGLGEEFALVSDWVMTSPWRAPLDYSNWNTFVSALEEGRSTKRIAEDMSRAKEYGLETPAWQLDVYINASDDTPAETLILGEENTAGTGFYGHNSQRGGIVLTDNRLTFARAKKTFDWRDPRILGFKDVSRVKQLSLFKKGQRQWVLERQAESGQWAIAAPKQLPASLSDVDALINRIDGLRMKDLAHVDISEVEVKWGLKNAPTVEIHAVVDEQGQSVTKVLKLSDVKAPNDSVYVHRSGYPWVGLLRSSALPELDQPLDALISRRPWSGQGDEVSEIRITKPDQAPLVFQKKESDWVLHGQVDKKLSGAFRILSLEAQRYVGPQAPKVQASTQKPRMTLTLVYKDREETLVLFDGSYKDKDTEVCAGKIGSTYYQFTLSDVEGIASAVEDVLDKKEAHPVVSLTPSQETQP